MGISTLQLFRQGLNSMIDKQADLSRTQQQISSGKRIINPSDDPSGSTRILNLSETERITDQYQSNIIHLRNRLEAEETVLGSAGDVLQRINELAIQGLNDSINPSDRASIASEVRQLTEELVALSNRQDGAGEYLFAGNQGSQKPFEDDGVGTFSYLGDQGQRRIRVAPDRTISNGNTGLDVFMKVATQSGGYESVFSTLYNLASDLEADTPNQASLGQVKQAMNHLLNIRADVGARQNALDNQERTNDALLIQLKQTRSDIEDVDIIEAAAKLNQQALTFQAAQQAFVRVQGLSLFNYL